jgi:hypothetical protein
MAAAAVDDDIAIERAHVGKMSIELFHWDVDRTGQVPAAELLGGPDVEEPRSRGDQLACLRALDLATSAEDEIAEDGDDGECSED